MTIELRKVMLRFVQEGRRAVKWATTLAAILHKRHEPNCPCWITKTLDYREHLWDIMLDIIEICNLNCAYGVEISAEQLKAYKTSERPRNHIAAMMAIYHQLYHYIVTAFVFSQEEIGTRLRRLLKRASIYVLGLRQIARAVGNRISKEEGDGWRFFTR